MNKSYVTVDSIDKLKDLIEHIKSCEIIAFDTETNSLNPRKGKIIGFSVSGEVGKGYYMPTMIFKDEELQDAVIEGKLAHDLAKKTISLLIGKKLIMHNASFDVKFVKCFYGVDLLSSLYVDTILLVHTVKEEGAGFMGGSAFGLKDIAKMIQKDIGLDVEKAANEEQIALKESIKRNGGQITRENYEIWKADLELLSEYASADTDLTLRVYNHFIKTLKDENLEKFFFEDEVMPLYKEVTIPMEQVGIKLDMELIKSSRAKIIEKLKEYAESVTKELLKNPDVRAWVVYKAQDAYPPNNKGTFAQELIKEMKFELEQSARTGKYSVTKSALMRLPECSAKHFLLHGDAAVLDRDISMKISMRLWREDNDGAYFNIQSKDQLGEIAFAVLGIKPLSTTKTGKPQFDDDTVQSIAGKYEWAKNLRIYNRLLKIKSTYMDRFLDAQEDGRYYFYYKQHGTVSGRYGSDAQQLPRPKEEGDDEPIVIEYNNLIRAFFIHEEGNIFVDCDYESLEPHTFAHVSGDEELKDIFRNNWDFYSTIAIKTEKLGQYSPDKKAPNFLRKLEPKLRNKAKAYALGIPYGMGAYALGMTLGIPTKEAKKLVDGYLNGFPELKKWMERSKKQAKEKGYVSTQVGRIRHLPKVKAIYDKIGDDLLDWNIKKEMERQYGVDQIKNLSRDYINGLNNSCNVQIQGLAASIVNRAALAINRKFKELDIRGWVCAQIHDQLVIEVEHDRSEEAARIVQDLMENTTKLSIDLKAPPTLAHNLRDGH
jgi:DNA polymerase I-like protein with 3'-5' exonuclease and polymerase domains